MNKLKQQTKFISVLLLKISKNFCIAPLADVVKPGLTTSQIMVLLILNDIKNTALPIGNLTKELAVSFPSVSGIVDRLYKKKLVERTRSKRDRRLVLIKLTSRGKKVVEKLIKSFDKLLFAVFKEMPMTKQKSFVKAIKNVFTFSTILSKNIYAAN